MSVGVAVGWYVSECGCDVRQLCMCVCRRLAAYDMQSQLAVHVAMDMLVVIEDLSKFSSSLLVHLFQSQTARDSLNS